MRETLRRFAPPPSGASLLERLRGASGAVLGLLLTGALCTWMAGGAGPLLMAPMGASAMLLFAAPASPFAQPWSVIGGNLASAVIGVLCARFIADPLLAAAVAAGSAIGAMFTLRCLHPPSAAVALTAVLGGPAVRAAGLHFVLSPVALNSGVLVAAAVAFNNLTGRRYPHPQATPKSAHQTADPPASLRPLLAESDLDAILARYDKVLDIGRQELHDLFRAAELRAFDRLFAEVSCADIMSRDVIAVTAKTPIARAWTLLLQHDFRALPVIDATRKVVGLIGDRDIAAWVERGGRRGEGGRVGEIMAPGVRTVAAEARVVDLAPLMADAGLRRIPVVDAEGRLVGIIAQSDLVAALLRGRLMAAPAGGTARP
jgi:CBS domain-containing membrane protein